jgi:ribosomal protein S18 acetylase RimI-like enzyme
VSGTLRPATAEECLGVWPAVASDRIFETAEQFSAYCEVAPWKIRVSEKGAAAVLGEWRRHLDVLAMRGVWCAERLVPDVCADAYDVAREHGFARVLSPLLPAVLLGGYLRAGMREYQRIVAIQSVPALVTHAEPAAGITLAIAGREDLSELVELDASCFDAFWRYGPVELAELLATERAVVARSGSGELIGYTLATVSRGAATLGRLAVSTEARRRGVGRMLVSDVTDWAISAGAITLGLCTQEDNAASRALYSACGLREIEERYALAIGNVGDVA